MTYRIRPLTRVYRYYPGTFLDADGLDVTVDAVLVAMVSTGTPVDASTTWTPAVMLPDPNRPGKLRLRVLLAGVDADPATAVVVPACGGDLYVRVVDNPEDDVVLVEHLDYTA